jgi:sarcosine oxidase subunit delta
MLLIHCPYCGEERPELEFRHAGEAHIARSQTIIETGDEEFEAFLYLRANTKGLVYERWRHVHGCGRFFNAIRDSVTDRFFTTYKVGQPKPDPSRFADAVAAVEPLAVEAAVVAPEPRQQPAAPAKAARKGAAATEATGSKVPDIKRDHAKVKASSAPEVGLAAKPKRKPPTTAKPVAATKSSAPKARKQVEAGKAESEAASDAPSKLIRKAPVKKGDA